MTTSKNLLKMGWRNASFAVALSACLINFTSCDKYDLDKTDPEVGVQASTAILLKMVITPTPLD